VILLAMVSVKLFSQGNNQDSLKSGGVYFTEMSHLLALKTYLLLKENTFEIAYQNQRIVLKPNSPVALGFGFNYKGIGLALGIGLPHSSENLSKYGKTKRLDIQMSIYSKRIGGDAYFQLYKGYFNENPQDFMSWEKDYFPQIPDMQTISFGCNIFYVLNHKKFSNKAAYSRTQVQQKSAGSFVLGYFLNYD